MEYFRLVCPGANTHRNAFAGRNFEYYSEDGFLSGSMSAATVGAAEKNGMYCYIKHFALNERETWRHYGLCTGPMSRQCVKFTSCRLKRL